MRVVVYPADRHGCGHHRLIWPVEILRAEGHDVHVVRQEDRKLRMHFRDDVLHDVEIDESVDVVVFQRVTHAALADAVPIIRARGVSVVIDVDDDLSTIHPANPAWQALRPGSTRFVDGRHDPSYQHSWRNLERACAAASLVTVTTPALTRRYALHGRGVIIPNYLADHYFGIVHDDSDIIGWPAALHSHPNDPEVVGNAIARLVAEGARFHVTSVSPGLGAAFRLGSDDVAETLRVPVALEDWPTAIAERIGIGIAPLADTEFNRAKSWLKPLEMAAVGVPWVGSPSDEYARLHALGCGVLARKPSDWYKILRSLRRDESRRRELSESGRAVADQLRLRDHAWRWLDAWEHARSFDKSSVDTGSRG